MIKKTWISTGTAGYWKVSFGTDSITCDDNELDETVEEMRQRHNL